MHNNSKFIHYLPLFLLIFIFISFIYFGMVQLLDKNDGVFVYNHDDAYIHMSMARNLAEYGNWGVNKGQFSSSSSSLLWTLILGLFFKIYGVHEGIPLIINLVLGIVLIITTYKILIFREIPTLYSFAGTLLIGFFAPMGFLVFSGLEHILHITVTILFVFFWSSELEKKRETVPPLPLFILTAFLPLIRYEGLFLISALIFVLLIMGRWSVALWCLLSAFLPLTLYGIISLREGWFFFPNSVFLKGSGLVLSVEGLLIFVYSGLKQLVYNFHILVFMGVLPLLIFIKKRSWFERDNIAAIMVMLTVLQHMIFAKSGYFTNMLFRIRYDSYLTVLLFLLVYILGISVLRSLKLKSFESLCIWLFCLFVLLGPAERGYRVESKSLRASANVYRQQYQMGLFLGKYYPDQKVAVNDIGLTSFLGEGEVVDLLGLGDREVGYGFYEKNYSSDFVDRVVREKGCEIAIVFDSLFRLTGLNENIPKSWIKVGEWKIPDNVICASDRVSFYAVRKGAFYKLYDSLKEFSQQLPADVKWRLKKIEK